MLENDGILNCFSNAKLHHPFFNCSHNTHHYLEFFKAIRKHVANDTLPLLLSLINKQQCEYDVGRAEYKKKLSGSEAISCVSTESSQSPFKKLKNATNDKN